MAQRVLTAAKAAKEDEFYTEFDFIEDEVRAYIKHNPDVFRGKTVLLPCDDPEWSNFTKYFAQNFERLGLKKLVSTSVAPNSKESHLVEQPTLFELDSPQFDESKSSTKGKIFVLESDSTGDNRIDIDDLKWSYLEGDGDFRSEEITQLRDEADVIVTNPPFSLFRAFLRWILDGQKDFLILARQTVITYREVFPLIGNNTVWLGTKIGDASFRVPDDYPEKSDRYWVDDSGQKWRSFGNITWLTNLQHGRPIRPKGLMTMEQNLRFGKDKTVAEFGYRKYVNYDAIDVPSINSIPSDFDGVMGVPITFLGKHVPEQFEIVGFRHGADGKDLRLEDGKTPFFRILIRHKRG